MEALETINPFTRLRGYTFPLIKCHFPWGEYHFRHIANSTLLLYDEKSSLNGILQIRRRPPFLDLWGGFLSDYLKGETEGK